ncbi:MAG: hypothetical protein Kow00127_13330 [Bacteroidales bacterium]
MTKTKSDFLKNLLIFSLILLIPSVAFIYLAPDNWVSPAFIYILPFFMGLTVVFHNLLLAGKGSAPTRFVNRFLLLTFGKMMLAILVILIYLALYRDDALAFAISFAFFYLVFTGFEVVQVLKIQKE